MRAQNPTQVLLSDGEKATLAEMALNTFSATEILERDPLHRLLTVVHII